MVLLNLLYESLVKLVGFLPHLYFIWCFVILISNVLIGLRGRLPLVLDLWTILNLILVGHRLKLFRILMVIVSLRALAKRFCFEHCKGIAQCIGRHHAERLPTIVLRNILIEVRLENVATSFILHRHLNRLSLVRYRLCLHISGLMHLLNRIDNFGNFFLG